MTREPSIPTPPTRGTSKPRTVQEDRATSGGVVRGSRVPWGAAVQALMCWRTLPWKVSTASRTESMNDPRPDPPLRPEGSGEGDPEGPQLLGGVGHEYGRVVADVADQAAVLAPLHLRSAPLRRPDQWCARADMIDDQGHRTCQTRLGRGVGVRVAESGSRQSACDVVVAEAVDNLELGAAAADLPAELVPRRV